MSQPIDYEKQFQADLERAQALSLESLALDKYRMQKKLQRLQIQTSRAASESSGCEASEISDQDDKRIRSERNQFKSRPRPGSFNLGQSNSIIAPPPSNQRRNSSAAVNITPNNTNDADLISFTSPTQTSSHSSLKDYCDQIHKLAQKNSDLVTFESNSGLVPTGLNNISTISYSSNFHATAPNVAPSPYGFQSHITSGLSIVPGVQPLNPTYQFPTIVPQIPPLPSIYTRAESYMPTLPCASTSIINSNIHVFKPLSKQNNSNLIDLASIDLSDSNSKQLNDTKNNVRVSVLEIFDPLLSNKNINNDTTLSKECIADDTVSECSGSMYDEYDPFDYLYNSSSVVPNTSDPIYAAVVKSDKVTLSPQSPPPLPPRIARTTLERKNKSFSNYVKKKNRLYENVIVIKKKAINDCELKAFHEMVKNLRGKFMCDDEITNPGYIISPMLNSKYRDGTSIKLTVYNFSQSLDTLKETAPITFTCDISTSVEHVTLHVLCELDQSPEEAHRLQVWGAAEYLAPGTLLEEYEYVHNCIKLEQDVILTLISEKLVDRSLSRTAQDDRRDTNLTLDDMLPSEPLVPISYDDLRILLETLESEMEKVELAAVELSSSSSRSASVAPALQSSGVVQAVKAICSLMGTIETSDISEALELFTTACLQFVPNPRTEVISEEGDYSVISLRNDSHSSVIPDLAGSISSHCERIRGAIQSLIEMYCQAFRVDFQLSSMNDLPTSTKTVAEVADSILVHVCALHRIPNTWKHVDYLVAAQVYHGTRPVGQPVLSIPVTVSNSFYPRVLFDCWLDMEGMSICQLAREARLVLVLYGRILEPPEKDEASSPPKYTKQEIGWASIQFFNYDGILMQGSMLVSLWPPVADKRVGPAPCFGSHPVSEHPLLGIELPGPPGRVTFPSAPPQSPTNREIKCDFSSLDENTQQQLLEIVEQDTLSRPQIESREILWEKRHYLHHLPSALPKVLLAAHSWDWACLSDLHEMLHNWTPMQPVEALQLLLPCFPDMEVRRCAVKWIEPLTNDELIDYLPQLVQALRYDTYEASSLVRFLLERALCSPRVSHHLYWLLTQSLPGQCPQNSGWDEVIQNEMSVSVSRHHRRLLLILRALWTICGEAQRQRFMSQQLLVKSLNEIAENIKQTKESLRLKSMGSALESVNQSLSDNPTCLPLSPSLIVTGVQSWSYFPSNTLPLKINFLAPDMSLIPAIFKAGDDLQQDMLTLQVVRIMDKLWLREGLDLKMVTFSCVPTGFKRGMIELVSSAETLRKIQVEFGLTGSFKDKPIAEWLAKHNPSELEYERAVENFTASCAGYSVVTYILGICDRHNDNIMLKTSGHVFHIDFGKFLGDAQMFGNFKRDRTPFVLTSDMAYVINGGDRPSERFHKFVDLCCQAFNIVRKQSNLILHLFALMVSSGIPGVTADAVNYVRRALLPEQSNAEAAAMFARLIESSLKSWFTQFNFFLHNLAQLRFTGDHGDGELLSFIPKVYSMSSDGRLLSVQVQCYQKRYDPNKHYVYIIRVERVGQPDPTHVLRSYKEFTEFHQKLCVHFPLAKIHSLPTGLHMGRSNIKQVAARRKTDIDLFLHSLFQTADEIAHSPLVYTFFHPLLRDQQPIDIHAKKIKERKVDQRNDIGRVKGELKLSVIYDRGILSVMVQHARSLPLVAGGQEPSTYVKVYLQPDPAKSTKRKTKVVKRSCHPTFMEMLEYRLPLDLIRSRILQATIWNHDPLQENEFLGGVELRLWEMPLEQEETHWFPLKNITR